MPGSGPDVKYARSAGVKTPFADSAAKCHFRLAWTRFRQEY